MTLSKKWETLWRKLNDADTEWATSGRSRRYYWRREALRQFKQTGREGKMTPEDAKPRDLDDLFEEGWKFKVGRIDGAGWFTAKETAEIAKAYGRACLHSYMDKAADTVERFENLFEEWSK